MSRIAEGNRIPEMIADMTDGNFGAINCLKGLLNYHLEKGLSAIRVMDEMEICGSKISMLFHFCCDDDYEQLLNVLTNAEIGILSKDEIANNLNQPYPEPFNNLLTGKELLQKVVNIATPVELEEILFEYSKKRS